MSAQAKLGMRQRYVSSELTHFVGRGKPEAEQYRLLVKILSEKLLSHPPHVRGQEPRMEVLGGDRKPSRNDLYNPSVVCFCDIPDTDLGIHMAKYGRFGLAFPKTALIPKGATPALYVERNARVNGAKLQHTWGEHLDIAADVVRELLRYQVNYITGGKGLRRLVEELIFKRSFNELVWTSLISSTVIHLLMSHVKVFDGTLGDGHPDNYYMEREWRIIGNVEFELAEVSRVYLPRKYGQQFRADVTAFAGGVHLVDD